MLVSVINAREAESNRVARLLHDEVGQVLSAVGLQLGVLRLDYKETVPEIAAATTEIQRMLETAMAQVREISYELNPNIVERVGLHFALERLVARFQLAPDSAAPRLFYELNERPPSEVANSLYKIAEQALEHRMRRHQIGQVQVIVKANARMLSLEIRDSEKSFAPEHLESLEAQLALPLMRFYAERGQLTLTYRAMPGKGSHLKAVHGRTPALKEKHSASL